MKIQASGAGAAAGAPLRSAEAGGAAFQPDTGALRDAAATGPASVLSAVSSLDALLALQEAGAPDERRRRAVRRGGRMLDALETLKLALLDGASPNEASLALGSLRDSLRDSLGDSLREEGGAFEDPRLSDLLLEIDTRAAVELAKLETAAAAGPAEGISGHYATR